MASGEEHVLHKLPCRGSKSGRTLKLAGKKTGGRNVSEQTTVLIVLTYQRLFTAVFSSTMIAKAVIITKIPELSAVKRPEKEGNDPHTDFCLRLLLPLREFVSWCCILTIGVPDHHRMRGRQAIAG